MMLYRYYWQITELVTNYVPNLLGAFLFLIIGWFVALILSALVGGLVSKTPLNKWLADSLGDNQHVGPIENKLKSIVYYTVLVFVLVGFFQTLGLTVITEPLNNLLNEIFTYAPRILAGCGLLLLAWIVANLIKVVITKAFSATNIEARLSRQIGWDEKDVPISKTVADTGYWLTLLFFLPAVLTAFALEGMLEPVNVLVSKVVGFIPNIFSAGVLLTIGWFIARIIQQVTTNLLKTVGIDKFAESTGIAKALGTHPLTHVIGTTVYIIIIVPVIISALDALAIDAVVQPAKHVLNLILGAVPYVLGGVLILFIGYVLGRIVSSVVNNVLTGLGFNNVLEWVGLTKGAIEGQRSPSAIVGYTAMIAILYFSLLEAFELMGFSTLTGLLQQFLIVVGQILMGLVILGIGLFLSNFAAKAIQESQVQQATLLAVATRWSIVLLSGAMSLRQMGLANEIINLAFGILLGAIGIAMALAFGFGGRDLAGRLLNEWVDTVKK